MSDTNEIQVEAPAPADVPNGSTPETSTVTAIAGESVVATRSLAVVMRAVERRQARSLMLGRLATVVLEEFRGTESSPPTKLARLPNGLRYALETEDVEELYLQLQGMAGEERAQLQAIHEAGVQVAPAAVDLPAATYVPGTAAPADDPASTVDNPAALRSSGSSRVARGGAAGGRPGSTKPAEWEDPSTES